MAVFDKNVFITDFKNHCVHVFSMEGTYLRRLGEPAITPYPIGVDVSKVRLLSLQTFDLYLIVYNCTIIVSSYIISLTGFSNECQ